MVTAHLTNRYLSVNKYGTEKDLRNKKRMTFKLFSSYVLHRLESNTERRNLLINLIRTEAA